jgi:hypothetical protein
LDTSLDFITIPGEGRPESVLMIFEGIDTQPNRLTIQKRQIMPY